MCIYNLGVDTAVLNVTPEPEDRREMLGSSCSKTKHHKLKTRETLEPQGQRKAKDPWGPKTSGKPMFLTRNSKHMQFQGEAMHTMVMLGEIK